MFRFGFCKAMVPACARVLNAVYTSQLKVSYFLGASWTEQVSQWRAGEIMKRIMRYKILLLSWKMGETSTVLVE